MTNPENKDNPAEKQGGVTIQTTAAPPDEPDENDRSAETLGEQRGQ